MEIDRDSPLQIFLAGIIQGSITEDSIHAQDYRETLKAVLRRCLPDADVYDPIDQHRNSLQYSFGKGRDVFLFHINKAAQADLLLAFVPQASMGTAIEMWEAFNRGRLVVAITPMQSNWAVKFLSHKVLPTIEEFERFAESGELAELITRHRQGIQHKKHREETQEAQKQSP